MQQLKVEHKNEDEVKRECKGRRLAISRNVFRIEKTDSFYCQSENKMNVYYFIRYAPETLIWCSCPDSSIRQMKCKHIWSIEYAIRLATVKDVDKLPAEILKKVTKSYTEDPSRLESQPNHHTTTEYSRLSTIIPKQVPTKSFNKEEYSF